MNAVDETILAEIETLILARMSTERLMAEVGRRGKVPLAHVPDTAIVQEFARRQLHMSRAETMIATTTRRSGVGYVDTETMRAWFNGWLDERVTPQEAQFLVILLDKWPDAVPHLESCYAIWQDSNKVDNLRPLVGMINKKFPGLIVPGKRGGLLGYRLAVERDECAIIPSDDARTPVTSMA